MLSPPLLLLLFLTATVRCTVKTCEQGQVWARGRELINAMKGQLVLVAFPTASDTTTLQKLSSLAESHPSIRVIALLDPSSCSIEQAAVMGRDWRWLVVDRDDLSSRQRLGLKQGEVALFDRCGRLSRTLPLAATEELNQSMRAAPHHASCGWCQYGTTESGGSNEGGKIDKKLDAFFQQAMATLSPNQQRAYPHHQNQQQQQQHQQQHTQQNQMPRLQHTTQHQQQQQRQYSHNQQQQQVGQSYNPQQHQQQQQQQQQAAYEQQLRQHHQSRQQHQQTPPSSPYSTQHQSASSGQTPGHITHSQIRQHEYAQRGMTIPQTDNAPLTTPSEDYSDYDEVMKGGTPKEKEVDLRKPAFNEDAQWATSSPFHQRRQHKDLFAMPPPTSSYSYSTREDTRKVVKQAVTTTTEPTKKTGAGFEDYDYGDYGAMKTFNNNDDKEDEVVEESRSTQSRPRSVDNRRNYDLENADEDEVPCKAITDDICYHQKKSGRKLSKCCKKGLYIADFCLPGKCSNTTVQACCMQKYLQAKFQCCENPDMDGTTATDAFSRCCHAHFVEEVTPAHSTVGPIPVEKTRDDCCPPEAAAEYWQSVHDICLPNVKADLSTVKFEIRLSDGIRVLDLAEPDKWQHECRYGGKRAQYVYVP